MSQKYLSFAFLFLNLVFSQASFLKGGPSTILADLKKIESRDFGKKILDTISLQLANKAPLQDVAKLLSDLKENLYQQQADSDKTHTIQEEECANEIKNYDERIALANKEIEESSQNIGTLNTQISQLKANIENAKLQLNILDKREANLVTNHDADVAAFHKRVEEHNQVLDALDIIIPKLESINQQASQEAVFAELSKIGKSNPIAALVSIAATLDPAALANVVNKLKEIRNSVATSLENDRVHEEEANNNFNALVKEINDVREGQKKRLREDNEALAEAEAKLQFETERRDRNQQELESASNGKAQKEATCEGWRKQYETNKAQRASEVDIITKVQNILATRLEGMKDYLKERDRKSVV